MPAIHPASLAPTESHSNALLALLEMHSASSPLIDLLVALTTDTVTFALGRPLSSTSSPHTFPTFVKQVIRRASLSTPVLLGSMVYIVRAKKYLSIAHEQWALERVFLGAAVVASKYLNDSCLKNHHWSTITQTFGTRDIGRIEREWCAVLDFEFSVSEKDILAFYPALAPHVPAAPVSTVPVTVKAPSPTPFEYGGFDILPSDVHSPSSETESEGSTMWDREELHTPDTSPFSPHHPSHPKSLSLSMQFPQDVDVHMHHPEHEERPRGRTSVQTKSAIDHRRSSSSHYSPRKSKFQIVHAKQPSMGSILRAFPLPIPGGAVRRARRQASVRVS